MELRLRKGSWMVLQQGEEVMLEHEREKVMQGEEEVKEEDRWKRRRAELTYNRTGSVRDGEAIEEKYSKGKKDSKTKKKIARQDLKKVSLSQNYQFP